MEIAGIIAEYNPFHNGHERHIGQTRAALGGDAGIVCCMSGDFVQRGEAAVYSKHVRAEAAVRCGADLVFELPLPWALSSAEGFARGAVGLLGGLGTVKYLSFGSECGEIEPLDKMAQALLDPLVGMAIREELSEGVSFAQARQTALARRVGEMATILDRPNNILAVEYVKAIYDQGLGMSPMTFLRFGAEHDADEGDGDFRSASELRARIAAGDRTDDFMPEEAAEALETEAERGRGPVLMSKLEPMLLSRLRMLGDEAFDELPDATEGLGNRLRAAVREEPTWDAVLAATKSKRYALSRIRRMAMCACLGVRAGMADGTPPYARVLAANETGREMLRGMQDRASIPIITKPATVRSLDREALGVYSLGASARDLYVLAYEAREERRGGSDWRTSPKMV